MKAGTEDKKKLAVAGVLGVCALGAAVYLYESLFSGPSSVPRAAPVTVTATTYSTRAAGVVTQPPSGAVAVKIGTSNGQLDPTLHMEAMRATESRVYSGTGRNIFSGASEAPRPVAIVQAKFPARTKLPVVAQVPVYTGPPQPPPINLKFFGIATSGGTRKALLLSGEDVFLASVGDVVQRRYRVVAIAASAITVEDLSNTNRQTLPLMGN